MALLVVPITKSPHPAGRVGPVVLQDWHRALARAQKIREANPGSRLLVISDVQIAGAPHEAEMYQDALRALGVADEAVIVAREAQETAGQVDAAARIARERGDELLLVSTFLHAPRVRWLARRLNARHVAVWGIPRPREAVTDLLLIFAFPCLDLLGLRGPFTRAVQARRKQGKF